MKRKIIWIAALLFLLLAGGYTWLRFYYLKVKDFKPDSSKEKSILDLRPALIAKLQQLVKDGSNGLYRLSVDKIDPDVLASTLDVTNMRIYIDSTVMRQLDDQKKLPDDIFNIRVDSMHIDGLGFTDLLDSKQVDLKSIKISRPLIDIFHQERVYNKETRQLNDSVSLYQRIKGQMDKISIGNINIEHATITNHTISNKPKSKSFQGIGIRMNNLLIDSSSQFDGTRFLFAKSVNINMKGYRIPTADSLYYFKTGDISISSDQHSITMADVEFSPRVSRKEFESKLRLRKSMYHMVFPKVSFYDVDWWAMMNQEKFISRKAEISGGSLDVYLDRSLPRNASPEIDNFPHQLIMNIPVPVSINSLELKHVNISYEEHNPNSKQSATVFFDNINGSLNHISNIATDIKKYPVADFSVTSLFMHHIPVSAKINVDLSKYKTGDFTADVHLDSTDRLTINSLVEPLGLFSMKSGQVQELTAHVSGNYRGTNCKVTVLYTDLHLSALKADENGELKKKPVTDFIANALFIKNANPSKGEPLRQPEFSVERDKHRNFFNLVWITISTGFLKTVGVPLKFVHRD